MILAQMTGNSGHQAGRQTGQDIPSAVPGVAIRQKRPRQKRAMSSTSTVASITCCNLRRFSCGVSVLVDDCYELTGGTLYEIHGLLCGLGPSATV